MERDVQKVSRQIEDGIRQEGCRDSSIGVQRAKEEDSMKPILKA